MTKRLIQQRRGKGKSLRFKSPSHRFKGAINIRKFDSVELSDKVKGEVKDLYHDPSKDAPMMLIEYDNNDLVTYPAPLGIKVGDEVESGFKAKVDKGNVLPLERIPEGMHVYCVENRPGSGAKFVRSSGGFARIIAHEDKGVVVQLPSRRTVLLKKNCRAVVGKIAGGGRKEKPLMKAVNKRLRRKARGKKHMKVSATTKNAVDHPHGGGGRRNKKNKSVSRNAPPGAKVGSISPKRTGSKRGKKK